MKWLQMYLDDHSLEQKTKINTLKSYEKLLSSTFTANLIAILWNGQSFYFWLAITKEKKHIQG